MNTNTDMNPRIISTNSAYAAKEIARAFPFSKKHSDTWVHYCHYCRYVGQKSHAGLEHKPYKSIRLLEIDDVWYRIPQVTRQLKKLMK